MTASSSFSFVVKAWRTTVGKQPWSVAQVYLALMRVINVFYALAFVGVFSVVPDYVHWLSWAMSLVVSLLLISWFQPYRTTKHVMSDGDDAILFGSGMIILTDVVLTGASRIPVISDWARSAQTRVDGVRDVVQDSTRSIILSTNKNNDAVEVVPGSKSSVDGAHVSGAEDTSLTVYRPSRRPKQ